LARWFLARRGGAVGIAFSGMGFGVVVMGPPAPWVIAPMGAGAAGARLGLGALGGRLPIAGGGGRGPAARAAAAAPAHLGAARPAGPQPRDGLRRSSREPTSGPAPDSALRQAIRTRTFWALWCAYLCTPLAVFPVTTHQVAFAIDRGFQPILAASIFGVMGLL